MNNQVTLAFDTIPRIRDIGFAKLAGSWLHPDRVLDFHVFLYIVNGEFLVVEEGEEYMLHAGEVFFLRKGLHHWGSSPMLAGTSWYWVHYDDEPLDQDIRETANIPQRGAVGGPMHDEDYRRRAVLPKRMKTAAPGPMKARLKELYEVYHQGEEYRPLTLGLRTANLLLEIRREADSMQKTTKAQATVNQIIEFLHNESLTQKYNGERLSAHMNMNYAYLSALFTKQVGMSIQAYHTRMRIHKAMELLKQPSVQIAEISERLGFSSPYHFSNSFKKTCGYSPSDYIKQIYYSR